MDTGEEQVAIGELAQLIDELRDNSEHTPVDSGGASRPTWLFVAVSLSLLLHGGLLLALLGLAADSVTAIDEFEHALAIALVERNPQQPQPEPEVEEEVQPVEEVEQPPDEEVLLVAEEVVDFEPELEIEPAQEAIEEPVIEPVPTDIENIADLTDSTIEEDLSEQAQPLPPESLLPNLVTLRDSLDRVEARNRATVYSRECNLLEEDNNLIDCESQRQPNYRASQRNATYRALNPIKAPTRTQRSLRTVARESLALAGNLRAADIPDGLVDYLLDELEIGMEINTHTGGNRALQDQKRLSGTWDPIARVAERVLNDPIAKDLVRRNVERRVHVDDN